MKLGLHLSHQTEISEAFSLSLMDEHGCRGRIHQLPAQHSKEGVQLEQNHILEELHHLYQNLNYAFCLIFFTVAIFKRSNIFGEKQHYIYRKELLSHGLFWVLEYILFASFYSYLMTFHYVPGCSKTLLPRFETVFTAVIFLCWFMAKAFCTWIIVQVLHLYSWMKAQWYYICHHFLLFW